MKKIGDDVLKRKEFYKKYYEVTNRQFSDRIIWGKEEREAADIKGQVYISKLGRKIGIIGQYVTLLIMVMLCAFLQYDFAVLIVGLTLCILQSLQYDFSILKIELLYKLMSKNTIYSRALRTAFFVGLDGELDKLRRMNKKNVRGFIRKNRSKFVVRYRIMRTNSSNTDVLSFCADKAVLSINGEKTVMNKNYETFEDLFLEVSQVFNNK